MKKLLFLILLSSILLISCQKEEPDTYIIEYSHCICPNPGPRMVTTLSNCSISEGGNLLDSLQSYTGDTITVYLHTCNSLGGLINISDVGDRLVSCSNDPIPFMVNYVVP
jgi:hypothetical protein